jgi:DNA-binding transcriptional MerR regulator
VPLVSPVFAAIERPVTTAQLAAHLQVSARTIARYREQRLIPFWRLNARRIMYRLSDVERVLARNDT